MSHDPRQTAGLYRSEYEHDACGVSFVVDLHGRDLIVLDPTARRTPIAAATPSLLAQLVAARAGV